MNCGKCHTCGQPVKIVCDGEEWCSRCDSYQRPVTHGWSRDYKDNSPCWTEPMLYDPTIDVSFEPLHWSKDSLDLLRPYLVVFDVTGREVEMYRDSEEEYTFPILAIHEIDSIWPDNGVCSMLTMKANVRSRWIPRGYQLECRGRFSDQIGYVSYICVSKKN